MQDAAGAGMMTPGYNAWAGYVDVTPSGHTATYPTALAMAKQYGGRALSVTTDADWTADIFDTETGAESLATNVAWQRKLTSPRPIHYIEAWQVNTLVDELAANGFPRRAYRILSAHLTERLGEHICGPTTCGPWSGVRYACDGTQWFSTTDYDVSVLLDTFFSTEEKDMVSTSVAMVAANGQVHVVVSRTWTTPTGKTVSHSDKHYFQDGDPAKTTKWHLDSTFPPA